MILVTTLMSMTLVLALGTTVLLTTMTETAIAASHRESHQTFYAAEAAVHYAVQDLGAVADWRVVIREGRTSSFVDGPADGVRTVGATVIDLSRATDDVGSLTLEGRNPLPWQLYAFGRLDDMLAMGPTGPPTYVVVWIVERTGKPQDEVVAIVGQAYGSGGSRRTVEVTVRRRRSAPDEDSEQPQVLSWRELR